MNGLQFLIRFFLYLNANIYIVKNLFKFNSFVFSKLRGPKSL